MSRRLRFLPILLLALLIAGLVWRLATPNDTNVRSNMIGKNLAGVKAPPALSGREGVFVGDPVRNPKVINFFASWCVPCVAEMPLLRELKRQGVLVDGIAVRDSPEDIAEFLRIRGDPYGAIGADPNSNIQMQFGSSGVPETFIIDPHGTVRYQHIGPLEQGDLQAIRNKVESLKK